MHSDVSYGNLDDGGSQGGHLIFLSDGLMVKVIETRYPGSQDV